jgi:hypothetical protein
VIFDHIYSDALGKAGDSPLDWGEKLPAIGDSYMLENERVRPAKCGKQWLALKK